MQCLNCQGGLVVLVVEPSSYFFCLSPPNTMRLCIWGILSQEKNNCLYDSCWSGIRCAFQVSMEYHR